jgi:hypothetical protein
MRKNYGATHYLTLCHFLFLRYKNRPHCFKQVSCWVWPHLNVVMAKTQQVSTSSKGCDRPCCSSGCQSPASHRGGQGSRSGFVVDKAALGQVFCEYFRFPAESFHRLLNIYRHPGLVDQIVGSVIVDRFHSTPKGGRNGCDL